MQIITRLLELDPNLAKTHYRLSSNIDETLFWGNYFHRCALMRAEVGASPPLPPKPRSEVRPLAAPPSCCLAQSARPWTIRVDDLSPNKADSSRDSLDLMRSTAGDGRKGSRLCTDTDDPALGSIVEGASAGTRGLGFEYLNLSSFGDEDGSRGIEVRCDQGHADDVGIIDAKHAAALDEIDAEVAAELGSDLEDNADFNMLEQDLSVEFNELERYDFQSVGGELGQSGSDDNSDLDAELEAEIARELGE